MHSSTPVVDWFVVMPEATRGKQNLSQPNPPCSSATHWRQNTSAVGGSKLCCCNWLQTQTTGTIGKCCEHCGHTTPQKCLLCYTDVIFKMIWNTTRIGPPTFVALQCGVHSRSQHFRENKSTPSHHSRNTDVKIFMSFSGPIPPCPFMVEIDWKISKSSTFCTF